MLKESPLELHHATRAGPLGGGCRCGRRDVLVVVRVVVVVGTRLARPASGRERAGQGKRLASTSFGQSQEQEPSWKET